MSSKKKILIGAGVSVLLVLAAVFVILFRVVRADGWREKEGVVSYKQDGKLLSGLQMIEGTQY